MKKEVFKDLFGQSIQWIETVKRTKDEDVLIKKLQKKEWTLISKINKSSVTFNQVYDIANSINILIDRKNIIIHHNDAWYLIVVKHKPNHELIKSMAKEIKEYKL